MAKDIRSSRVSRSSRGSLKRIVEKDTKEWDDVRCPICMEHPHNAVLLLCSSSDRGCRVFMCDTSYRHSNCFDQFCKLVSGAASSHSQLSGSVTCPLCRGTVRGWTVDAAARSYMNSKRRSCSTESCGFVGDYKALRRHARLEHPCGRPTVADPERQRNWSRMEQQRDLGDLLSNLRSAIDRGVEDLLRGDADHQGDQIFITGDPLPVSLLIDNIAYEFGEPTQPSVGPMMVRWSSTGGPESTQHTWMPWEVMDYDDARILNELTIIADADVEIDIDMFCEDASTSRAGRGQRRLMPRDFLIDDATTMSGVDVGYGGPGRATDVVAHENATMRQVHGDMSRRSVGGRRRLRPWDVVVDIEDADGVGRFASVGDGVEFYIDASSHEDASMLSRRASTRESGRRLRRRGTWEENNGLDGSSLLGFPPIDDACIEIDVGMWDQVELPSPPQRRTRRRTLRAYVDDYIP